MSVVTERRYENLVEDERIHGSLYFSQEVFDDELERIWYRTWVFIGHDSEVPEPGDYVRKSLGLQPVVMTRDRDGEIHVVLNRCAHLGNLVCHEPRGNAKGLRCPYHGWTYGLDGSNMGVPYPEAFGPDFDKKSMGLGRPARVDSYRGFVFASMSKEGPDLMEHLGNAKPAIDRLCDLSPEGEIELPAGWLRHQARANWKMALENYLDGYHPRFVHRALVSMTSNTIFQLGNDDGPSRIRAIGNGHGEVDFTPHYRNADQELLWIAGSREKMPRYIEALEAARGKERAHELLVDGPPHTMIFPNLYLGELFIEVLEPQAPGSFVQGDTPIFWKGGAELNERNMRQTGASIGPAGMVLADDVAMWERNYKGLGAHEPEWLIRQRGGHNTEHLDHGVESGLVTYDTAIMGFWREYRDLMTAS